MSDDQHQHYPTSLDQTERTTSPSQQSMSPPQGDTCSSRSGASPDPDHTTKVAAGWPSAIPPHPNHQSGSSLGNKRTRTPPSSSSQPPAHTRAKRYDPSDSALGLLEGYAHEGVEAEERPLLPDLSYVPGVLFLLLSGVGLTRLIDVGSELCFEADDPETLYAEPKRVL
ncbi:hypothetical protein SERLA73DRAFT_77742 [Serpula lacrymans var. lacrymans S7.3]|uniref:Uncharacterized protein n=2 Tax=Serpula lacrymans var. lacrymans TaxID=341189 RepID=F8QAT9_SERL3|nr:uncharacterized protein SERLADRAFT_442642 [Serpula lacrymans var. lacrymans S7.9]EGN94325.1 hypothetical protein SERLA73DRAFT_77742 [Serpula lacrymans var. lacrymans S7.3]EGO19813.1 hypothetical protein SERLADRAFT_442642 [Serpula lacrymans var. lacrymans S7.9]